MYIICPKIVKERGGLVLVQGLPPRSPQEGQFV